MKVDSEDGVFLYKFCCIVLLQCSVVYDIRLNT